MKKHLKPKLVGASVLAALLSTSALAADVTMMDVPSSYDWTGLYVGLIVGGGWATSNHTDTTGTTSGDFDQSGFLFGGTVGYNWQHDNYVFGIEADLAYSTIGETVRPVVCGAGCFTDMDAFGTLRPRIGYAFGRYLPYITGGLAFGHLDYGQNGIINRSSWEAGWTIGAGLEAQLDQNWSLKAEYLYGSLNEGSYTLAIPVSVDEDDISIVRFGLNYRFSGGLF